MAQPDGTLKYDTLINSNGFKSGLAKISNLAKTALQGAATLLASATAALSAGAMAGVKYNAQMEQYITSFGTMLGSAEKAQNMISQIKKFAAETPFELPDLAKGAQTLLAFGTAEEKVLPIMKMLGDVSQGNKEKFDGLTLAFAQCQSTGKLMGQDLLQMINQGFNPLNEISKMTGKSVAQLKEEMSKGAISAEMVAAAFEHATSEGGQFYNAMEAQSKTFSGQLSTLKDNALSLLGEITESFTGSLKDTALPLVNGWMTDLADAFHQGGHEGLVVAAGDVMSDALVTAAENAPGTVQAAAGLIRSFAAGVSKNKKRIYSAAVDIAATLGNALADLLPKSISIPVKKAISSVQRSFESGGLKKAVTSTTKFISAFGDAVGDVAEIALPVLTKGVDLLADNLDVLIPMSLSAAAAVKAMSIAQSVSSGITALSASIKNATAAANAVPKAASAMKGLAEAMKAASSSGAGLSGVLGSMIGPQGLIILGAAALGIFSAAVYKHLKKPVEDVKDGLSDMGESMADFYDDLSSAESHLSDFGTAFAALNDQQRELESAAAEVQASITATLEKGVTEREGLTQTDLQNLQGYYDELNRIYAEQLEIEHQKTATVAEIQLQQVSSYSGTAEQLRTTGLESLATLREQINNEIALMDEQLTAETVNSQNRIGVDGWTQQEHEKWLELRIASDQAHKSELEALLGQIASVSAKKNAEQLMQDEAFNAAVTGYHSSLETEMQRHADQQKFIRDTMFLDTDLANSQMITEEIIHQQTLRSIWATMTSDLSDEQKEQISGMLMFAAETKRTGVVLDKETQDVIKMILDSWETLPQEGKDTVANLIDPMLEDMGIKGAQLEGASEELGNSIIDRLREACGVHSPSWKTREIMDYVMQGAEQGLDGRTPSLLSKAASIANSIISTISQAFKVHSPSRVMEDIFGYVMEGGELGLLENAPSLFRAADSIAAGVLSRLSIGDADNFIAHAQGMVQRMRSTPALRMSAWGTLASQRETPAFAPGAGGTVTNLYQTINTHDSLSESELTREAENLLERSRWKNP